MRFLTQISVEMTNIHQTNILSMLFFIIEILPTVVKIVTPVGFYRDTNHSIN